MSTHLGAVAHPILRIDALSQCHLQVLHEVHHALLGCCGEVLLYVHLTCCLTQDTVHYTYGTLPARLLLLASAEGTAIEIETLIGKGIAQFVCRSVEQVPLEVGDDVLYGLFAHDARYFEEGLGL